MSREALASESTAVLAKHGRSFSLASWFLPPEGRGDAAILYAFCRLVDDLVDEADDDHQARHDVGELREELEGSRPARALVKEVRRILEPIGIQPALDLIAGCEGDLTFEQPADDAALEHYCYQVAGTVGWMMCPVLGVSDPDALRHAIDLGKGMQLTNICRDVLEDAENGRVYLPKSRFPHGPEAVTAHPEEVRAVVADLLERAEAFYVSGQQGYAAIPLRSRVAIAVAARLYRGIGRRLVRKGGSPLDGRTIVPMWEKLILVGRSAGDLV